MLEERVKILVLGPSKSGKTCLVNYLSNFKDTPTTQYKETISLRIMDFEPEGLTLPDRSIRVVVELWDVSGNHTYQSCWPAIANGAHGIVYVFNIEQKNQLAELEHWHKTFATPAGVLGPNTPHIRDENSIVFAHRSTAPQGNIKTQKPRLPGKLQDMRCVATSLDYPAETNWKGDFDKLVTNIVMSQRQEEENALLNSGMDGPLPVQSSH
eukprot:TRINITY_DN51017_c0_g1_i1.p2 TRINITY_DN51017_c0_g1~~TRINITY_DN51017_c0_g1_i1.p2  ORF type:complete len:211 (+),score=72.85 TRINITY_DN51017_c0_g1_i1:915-1547(+)